MSDYTPKRFFASDNCATVHPEILEAIARVNVGHEKPYGNDYYTKLANDKLKEFFDCDCDTYFVWNGTGSNVTALKTCMPTYGAVLTVDSAHINTNECGAFELVTGGKIITVPNVDGKLTPEAMKVRLSAAKSEHISMIKAVSISQTTERGTVYTIDEIRAIADIAHENGLYLHVDGARISNAAVGLGCHIRDTTVGAGVDLLSFGGTKNGMLCGESVVIFRKELKENFKYIRKQAMQLNCKMRYTSAQFIAFIENDLWRRMAEHSNGLATYLSDEFEAMGVKLQTPTGANTVMALIPPAFVHKLQERFGFYLRDENTGLVRIMVSFDTTKEDIDELLDAVRDEMAAIN